jgi:pSer/pThr/pTyr-binding forkhead associated (FHA) protein
MARVIVSNGPEAGRGFEVPEAGTIVGRVSGPSCDIGLGGSSVSGRHARIYFDSGRSAWFVRDLGSVNGTRVDGRSVDLSELREGALICFSEIEVVFSLESVSVAEPFVGAESSLTDSGWGAASSQQQGGGGAPPHSSAVDVPALRSNASFLRSVSQGADIALDTLETELEALKRAMAMRDPTQAHLAVARVIDSGKLEKCLQELRNIRQAEVGVLDSIEELLESK